MSILAVPLLGPSYMKQLAGKLLVASPSWAFEREFRPVFLVLEHDGPRVKAVLLNHPTGKSVRNLWESVTDEPCVSDEPLLFGGPVSGPVVALHTQKRWGELKVPHGLYVAIHQQVLAEMVQQTDHPFRIFVGHSGWRARKLRKELKRGRWLTVPATPDLIFANSDTMWTQCLQAAGKAVLAHAPGVKPWLNVVNPAWN